MALYTLQVQIEANSLREAEDNLKKMQDIVANYKKHRIVEFIAEVADNYLEYTKEKRESDERLRKAKEKYEWSKKSWQPRSMRS